MHTREKPRHAATNTPRSAALMPVLPSPASWCGCALLFALLFALSLSLAPCGQLWAPARVLLLSSSLPFRARHVPGSHTAAARLSAPTSTSVLHRASQLRTRHRPYSPARRSSRRESMHATPLLPSPSSSSSNTARPAAQCGFACQAEPSPSSRHSPSPSPLPSPLPSPCCVQTGTATFALSIPLVDCRCSYTGMFTWRNGLLVDALTKGYWLLIDNVNFCSPSVLDRLNGLLEPKGVLIVNERGVIDGQVCHLNKARPGA